MTFSLSKAGMQNGSGDSQVERWVDLFPVPYLQSPATAALTQEVIGTSLYRANFFQQAQDDSVSMCYQMPHTWVIGSSVRPHMHFIPHGTAPTDGYLAIDGYYAWTYIGDTTLTIPTATANWTYFQARKQIVTENLFTEMVISPGYISPPASWTTSSIGRSAHLHLFWRRPGSLYPDLDTFDSLKPIGIGAANIQLVSFDCHVLVKGTGSVNEFAIPY